MKKKSILALIAVIFTLLSIPLNCFAADDGCCYDMNNDDIAACIDFGKKVINEWYEETDKEECKWIFSCIYTPELYEKMGKELSSDGKVFAHVRTEEYGLYDGCLYCEFTVQAECVGADGKVLGGFGDSVKIIFVKTSSGYKIADWYGGESNFDSDCITKGYISNLKNRYLWFGQGTKQHINQCKRYLESVDMSGKVSFVEQLQEYIFTSGKKCVKLSKN